MKSKTLSPANLASQFMARIKRRQATTPVPPQASLAFLPTKDKLRYLAALVPIALSEGPLDERKLRRFYQLFAMMKLRKDQRSAFLKQLFFDNAKAAVQDSVFSTPDVRISLAKDALFLEATTHPEQTSEAAQKLFSQLGLTKPQLQVLLAWTAWENSILEKLGRGDLVVTKKDLPVEHFKKAVSVGIPLSALYLSGSVVGFSAAGITSGLAALGTSSGLALLGLGLNPMTAGIVALIVGGITVKKILDAILPTSHGDEQSLVSAAQEMTLIRQRYLHYISEDLELLKSGRWTERFTGKRRQRLTGLRLLQSLASTDEANALPDILKSAHS